MLISKNDILINSFGIICSYSNKIKEMRLMAQEKLALIRRELQEVVLSLQHLQRSEDNVNQQGIALLILLI